MHAALLLSTFFLLLVACGAASHENSTTSGLAIPDDEKFKIFLNHVIKIKENAIASIEYRYFEQVFLDGQYFEDYSYILNFEKGKYHGYCNISRPDMPRILIEHSSEMEDLKSFESVTTVVFDDKKYVMKSAQEYVEEPGNIITHMMSAALTYSDGMVYEASGKVVNDNGAYTVEMTMPSVTNLQDTMKMNLNGVSFYHPSSPHVLNLTIKSQDTFLSYNATSDLLEEGKSERFGEADLTLQCKYFPDITGNLRINKNEMGMNVTVDAMVDGEKYVGSMDHRIEQIDGYMVHKISGNMMHPNIQRPLLGELVIENRYTNYYIIELKLNNEVFLAQEVAMERNGLTPVGIMIAEFGTFSQSFYLKLASPLIDRDTFAIIMEHEYSREEEGIQDRVLFNLNSSMFPKIDMHAIFKQVDYYYKVEGKIWGNIDRNDYMMSMGKTTNIVPGASGDMKIYTMQGNMDLPEMTPMAATMVIKDDNGNFTVDVTSEEFETIKFNSNYSYIMDRYNDYYKTARNLFLESEMMQGNMTLESETSYNSYGPPNSENNLLLHFNSKWTPPISMKIDDTLTKEYGCDVVAVLDIGDQSFGLSYDYLNAVSPQRNFFRVNTRLTAPDKTPELGFFKVSMLHNRSETRHEIDYEMSKYWIYPEILKYIKNDGNIWN